MASSSGARSRAPATAEARIDKAVADYLAFHGLNHSLSVFLEETRTVRPTEAGRRAGGKPSARILQNMMRAFDAGQRDDFMRFWGIYVPVEAQGAAATGGSALARAGKRLVFYCHVHFAVFPFRRHSGRSVPPEAALYMKSLKEYLDGPGSDLAKTAEFIAYFALPFVPDPRLHDSFAPLFEQVWVDDLRSQLQTFLGRALEDIDSRPPTLYKVFRAAHAHSQQRRQRVSGVGSVASGVSNMSPSSVSAALSYDDVPGSGKQVHRNGVDQSLVVGAAGSARALGVAASKVMRAARRAVADADARGPEAVAVAAVGTLRRAADMLAEAIKAARPGLQRAERVVGRADKQVSLDRDAAHRGYGHDQHSPKQASGGVSLADIGPEATPEDQHSSNPAGGAAAAGTDFGRSRIRLGADARKESVGPGRWHSEASLMPLSWGRVRRDLSRYAVAAASGSVSSGRKCCLLLQGLRWRVTHTKPGRARRQLLRSWVSGDALGVHASGPPRSAASRRRSTRPSDAPDHADGAVVSGSAALANASKSTDAVEGDTAPSTAADPVASTSTSSSSAASAAAGTVSQPAPASTGQLGPVIVRLLRCPAPAVCEAACRVVNAVASEAVGRGYLVRAQGLVAALLSVLKTEAGDTAARQNALGALQKISLRHGAQREMIAGGAMEWTTAALSGHATWRKARVRRREAAAAARQAADVLTSGDGPPGAVAEAEASRTRADAAACAEAEAEAGRFRLVPYSVEYAAALLMNLSLRRSGRQRAAAMGAGDDGGVGVAVLDLLEDALQIGLVGRGPAADSDSEGKDHDDDDGDDDDAEADAAEQVHTYVNGALYSLLTAGDILVAAKARGLSRAVASAMNNASEPHKRHLAFIQGQLEAETPVEEVDSDEEEDGTGADEEAEEAEAAEDADAMGADDDADDDGDDDDGDEEDGDADDVLEADLSAGEAGGEDLLVAEYSVEAVNERAAAQLAAEHAAIAAGAGRGGGSAGGRGGLSSAGAAGRGGGSAGGPPLRPVTPGHPRSKRQQPAELESRPKLLRTPPGIAKGRLMSAIDETGMSHGSLLETGTARWPGRDRYVSGESGGGGSPDEHVGGFASRVSGSRPDLGADALHEIAAAAEHGDDDGDNDEDGLGLAPAGRLPPDTPDTLAGGGGIWGRNDDDGMQEEEDGGSGLVTPRDDLDLDGVDDEDIHEAPSRATPAAANRASARADRSTGGGARASHASSRASLPAGDDVADEAPPYQVFAARPRISRSPASNPGSLW